MTHVIRISSTTDTYTYPSYVTRSAGTGVIGVRTTPHL